MCNLYSITKGQAAIIAFTRAMRDLTGNLPPMPGVFPDYAAPIVRNGRAPAKPLGQDLCFVSNLPASTASVGSLRKSS
jgi:hypothetical protein